MLYSFQQGDDKCEDFQTRASVIFPGVEQESYFCGEEKSIFLNIRIMYFKVHHKVYLSDGSHIFLG